MTQEWGPAAERGLSAGSDRLVSLRALDTEVHPRR
jgi:hypothetical protein